MLVHLVVTLALIVLACVSIWAVHHGLGRRMPRALLPMAAGAVAIGYGVYAEYSWSGRTEAAMPASFVVMQRGGERSALAPWTWIFSRDVRLSAVDTAAVRRHPEHPELRLLEVMLFERFYPVRLIGQLVDCAGIRRADIVDGETLSADGLPVSPRWLEVAADDRIVDVACTDTV